MKTLSNNLQRYTLYMLTFAALIFNVACGGGSGGGGSSATAASAITLNTTTVAPNSSTLIQPTGGTSPYTFTVISGSGTLSATSGTLTYLTSTSAVGSIVTLQVTDSAGQAIQFPLYVESSVGASGVGNGVITITNTVLTVLPSSTLTMTATGGSGVYTWSVISPVGQGSFAGSVFYAPATAQSVEVEVSDTAGNTSYTYITVSTTASTGAIGNCEGTYSMSFSGYTASLAIVEDSAGNIAGEIVLGNGSAAIIGTCVSNGTNGGTINFIDENATGGPVPFTGTFTNISTSQTFISGTYQYGGTQSWTAITN